MGNKKNVYNENFHGTLKDARLRENELKLAYKNNSLIRKTNFSMSDLLDEYLEYNKERWTPKTYEANKLWIRNIKEYLGYILK